MAGVIGDNLIAAFKTEGYTSENIIAVRRLRSGDIML